jgi:hypothetical protein
VSGVVVTAGVGAGDGTGAGSLVRFVETVVFVDVDAFSVDLSARGRTVYRPESSCESPARGRRLDPEPEFSSNAELGSIDDSASAFAKAKTKDVVMIAVNIEVDFISQLIGSNGVALDETTGVSCYENLFQPHRKCRLNE